MGFPARRVGEAIRRPATAVVVSMLLALGLTTVPVGQAAGSERCASPFVDVSAGALYADAVAWMATTGITTGTSATTFSPGDVVTRGQFAAFL